MTGFYTFCYFLSNFSKIIGHVHVKLGRAFYSFLIVLVCNIALAQTNTKKTKDDFNKLAWIEGTWTRTNSKAGQSGIESWQKISPFEFRGSGVTLKGADTLFIEKLKIEIRDNSIYYVSDVPENPNPISFTLTEITESGFVCENPQHDFPKKILYQLNGKSLKATISGDGKSIDYFFIRD